MFDIVYTAFPVKFCFFLFLKKAQYCKVHWRVPSLSSVNSRSSPSSGDSLSMSCTQPCPCKCTCTVRQNSKVKSEPLHHPVRSLDLDGVNGWLVVEFHIVLYPMGRISQDQSHPLKFKHNFFFLITIWFYWSIHHKQYLLLLLFFIFFYIFIFF